MAKIDLTRKIG